IQQMTVMLDDPKWYESADDKKQLDELATDDMAIELYNKDGVKLYHSNPDLDFEGVMNQEQLYKDLYEVQEGLQAYTYKEPVLDRKSTRLNSSHVSISYAVFCLKKKTS